MHYKDYNIKDNIQALLASSFSASSTLLTVKTGSGANMPWAGTIYTLEKVDPMTRQVLQMEKVMCTSKAGDNFQMIRAFSNTTAYNWVKWDFISLYVVEEHEWNNQNNKISTDLRNVFAENAYDNLTNTYNHTGWDGIPNRASTDLVKWTIIYFAPIAVNTTDNPKFAIWWSWPKDIQKGNKIIWNGELIQNHIYCIVFDWNVRHIIWDNMKTSEANTISQPVKNSNATSGKFVYYTAGEYHNISWLSNKIPLWMVDKIWDVITSSGIVKITALADIWTWMNVWDNLWYEKTTGTITNSTNSTGWYLWYIKSATEFHLNIWVNSIIPIFSSNWIPVWTDLFRVSLKNNPDITIWGIIWKKFSPKLPWTYIIKTTRVISWSYSAWLWTAPDVFEITWPSSWNLVANGSVHDFYMSSGQNAKYIIDYCTPFYADWTKEFIVKTDGTDYYNVELCRWYDFVWQNINYLNKMYYKIYSANPARNHWWFMSSWVSTPNIKTDTNSMSVNNNVPLYSLSWWQFNINYTGNIDVNVTSEIYAAYWITIWHELLKNWVVVASNTIVLPNWWFMSSSYVRTLTYSWTITSWDIFGIKCYGSSWVVSNWPLSINLV